VTDGPTYVLDANVLIEAARHYYAFDLAPRFWESLVSHADDGRIQSIDKVKAELERGKNGLAEWVKRDFDGAFASTDDTDVIQVFSEIMTWVNGQDQFSNAAEAAFAGGADGWLVAYAKMKGYVVVTHEVLAPDVRRKVPIPNVCKEFDVEYIDTFEMLRRLGVRFE